MSGVPYTSLDNHEELARQMISLPVSFNLGQYQCKTIRGIKRYESDALSSAGDPFARLRNDDLAEEEESNSSYLLLTILV
ncbi:hypothetical protein WN51_12437 [Melipona quadrifasciata]|uniref:Uncharacterized protein n=1 Tax=Melipona quadrifasciata TaxID=166423 RepID=A0A0M9A2Q5_9HYME|nr:hypothetical protein WN51_12437 [Melipona quadrifasciata]